MKITFYTNFINHHQVHVADEMYRMLGDDYKFVVTMAVPQNVLKSGYPDYSDRPYLVKAYLGKNEEYDALKLSETSDIVIVGSAPKKYFIDRLKQNKIVFAYSERWFKHFRIGYLNPKTWLYFFNTYTKYRNKQYYMLCASAFTARDCSKIGAFPDKTFKWGYFTKTPSFDLKAYIDKKKAAARIDILWCARFIKVKHPEMVISLAQYLKSKKYNFHINMIGDGELLEKTKMTILNGNLSDCVKLCGNLPNDEVLEMMRNSHVFLFTSDRGEGWGAVLSESMSAGCAVVAADKIGSVPFLISNNRNGLIFKSCNQTSLNSAVTYLFENPDSVYRLGENAYRTMHEIWSPQNAAHNFIKLSSSIIEHQKINIEEGPCSKAEII